MDCLKNEIGITQKCTSIVRKTHKTMMENGWCLTPGASFRMFFMVLIIHHASFCFEATEYIPFSSDGSSESRWIR